MNCRFTDEEITYMHELGLACDFNALDRGDLYWNDIEKAVGGRYKEIIEFLRDRPRSKLRHKLRAELPIVEKIMNKVPLVCRFTDKQVEYMEKVLELVFFFENIPLMPPDCELDDDENKWPLGYRIVEALHDREVSVSMDIVYLTEELTRKLTPEEEKLVAERYDEEHLMDTIYSVLHYYLY